ncbi:glycoside hydrolase family 43 protein [Sphingobacterium sp. SGR-19]|uniref:glycoside hydrolase family 43 protein n=1 Tax=Sphingobacterium sp. SGR-19 TaxID=2710886 RepID=UPI0019D31D04|nr:glycoside hydrolase family 43 protein [Sphingobacterium sp. SGR-19]
MFSNCFMLALTLFWSCKSSSNVAPTENQKDDDPATVVVATVSDLVAEETNKKNELRLSWINPPGTVSVALSYTEEGTDTEHIVTPHIRVDGASRSSYVLKLPRYATYKVTAIAMDNYGRKSEAHTITATPAEENSYEVIENKLPIADPYVLYHGGKYYAYGTRVNGFEVYMSEDLKHWRRSEHLALSPENSWGDRWFWAPEVYYVESKNRFYMFYSVDEHICVATSSRPEGPFIQQEKKPIVTEKAIDTHFYMDEDGTPYLYYVRFTGGNVIWVAEMNDDLISIKPETLTECIRAQDAWERKQGTIAEGPSVLKRGDTYYLMYSANHFESKDYAVGYATATSPKGPWKKYEGNPVLRRDMPAADGLVGTGHGAPFVTANGSFRYIYHAHANENNVQPRTSFINQMDFSAEGIIRIFGDAIHPVVVK